MSPSADQIAPETHRVGAAQRSAAAHAGSVRALRSDASRAHVTRSGLDA